MATGPEHYRRAQELLFNAYQMEGGSAEEQGALAAAQVHATLALTAATVAAVPAAWHNSSWRDLLAHPTKTEETP